MKTITILRHSIRAAGQNLSPEGVALAREAAKKLNPEYNIVVTSDLPRAIETAEAMGFTVNEHNEILCPPGEIVDLEVYWDGDFDEFPPAYRQKKHLYEFAVKLREYIKTIAKSLPENGNALIISHGGVVQAAAAGCFPEKDFREFGRSPKYCEGIKIFIEGTEFKDINIIRNVG